MLQAYLKEIKAKTVLLIAKKGLIPLYEKVGFTLVGESPVVHGKDPWFELRLNIAG